MPTLVVTSSRRNVRTGGFNPSGSSAVATMSSPARSTSISSDVAACVTANTSLLCDGDSGPPFCRTSIWRWCSDSISTKSSNSGARSAASRPASCRLRRKAACDSDSAFVAAKPPPPPDADAGECAVAAPTAGGCWFTRRSNTLRAVVARRSRSANDGRGVPPCWSSPCAAPPSPST